MLVSISSEKGTEQIKIRNEEKKVYIVLTEYDITTDYSGEKIFEFTLS